MTARKSVAARVEEATEKVRNRETKRGASGELGRRKTKKKKKTNNGRERKRERGRH